MQTYTFIGSDKNAGKTTAMNFVYHELRGRMIADHSICLTSIGINGEAVDTFDNREKPAINIEPDTLFMTASEHLTGLDGSYEEINVIKNPGFTKPYTLGRTLSALKLVLEGPNDKAGIQAFKEIIAWYNSRSICLIDGSVDRQFIGHPNISDGIFYSLLVTDRVEQQAKLRDFLVAIMLPETNQTVKTRIFEKRLGQPTSLLMKENGNVVYRGFQVPFLDELLKANIRLTAQEQMLLYLEGALSRTLYDFLAPFDRLTVVLDSFTRYLNISTDTALRKVFQPKLMINHIVPIICIFLNLETDHYQLELPPEVPVINLFGDTSNTGIFGNGTVKLPGLEETADSNGL